MTCRKAQLLEDEETLTLIPPVGIGRISLSRGALPVTIPVRYRRTGNGILVRLNRDDHLTNGLVGAVIGFQVDSFHDDGAGWTANVIGQAVATSDDDAVLLPFDIVSGTRYYGL
jgi:hypothetical protein